MSWRAIHVACLLACTCACSGGDATPADRRPATATATADGDSARVAATANSASAPPANTPPTAAAGTRSPLPADAGPAALADVGVRLVGQEQEYLLGDEHKVRVRFVPLEDWDERFDERHSRIALSRGRCDLEITLHCGGWCDEPDKFRANIREHARETFEFTRSKNHLPRLRPRWTTKPRAETPELHFYRFVADGPKVRQREEHLQVDRILPGIGRILSCYAEIEGACRTFSWFRNDDERVAAYTAAADDLEKFCRSLEVEVVDR